MKFLLLIGICSGLSGCALTLEMMAISGISYLATGKSVSDNALSVLTDQDCALHHIIMDKAVCVESVKNVEYVENSLSPNDNNSELLLARAKTVNIVEIEAMPAENIIDSIKNLPSDVVARSATQSISDFSVTIEQTIEKTKASPTEYLRVQTFAVVGSFNSYQYAQRRNEKYLSFNPQIITTPVHSATQYRVVVGPVNRHHFIAELPVMVGAETQLPWEIDLCVNDMSPPPCNNTYAANIMFK